MSETTQEGTGQQIPEQQRVQPKLVTNYPTDTLVYTAPYNLPISFQQLLAQAGGGGAGPGVTLPLAIADGGTGAITAAAARTALGITQANLGGPFLALAGGTLTGPLVSYPSIAGRLLEFVNYGGGSTAYFACQDVSAVALEVVNDGNGTALIVVGNSWFYEGPIRVGMTTGTAITTAGNVNVAGYRPMAGHWRQHCAPAVVR